MMRCGNFKIKISTEGSVWIFTPRQTFHPLQNALDEMPQQHYNFSTDQYFS